jgi:hypothetical protein
MKKPGPWWNPNLDANIKAVVVYGPICSRPLKWWEKCLEWLGWRVRFLQRPIRYLIHIPTRMLTEDEIARIASAMAEIE